MKYYAIVILASYLMGLLLWKTNPRMRKGLMLVLCVLLTITFYFLNKI